ncbi:MAG: hypothetical protein LAO05_05870 [Acidobacteriia bacterium]|nr:hypothetical protein [Terriglobia bacterium]
MRLVLEASIGLTLGLLAVGTTAAQQEPALPTPETALTRACDAAGGIEAFKNLGIVAIASKSEELTQEGGTATTLRNSYFLAPGPIPGRFEYPDKNVVAGDDGSGGWALINRKPDTRLATSYRVQRSLATSLFPMLLPFSLTWNGVSIQKIKAAQLQGHPVWQLTIEVPRTFFDTPQISTIWTVLLDRSTFAVVRAESPFTDLGKGMTADGMRFTWRNPVKIKNVTFYQEQRVMGLDEVGQEKTHNRVDHLQFHIVPTSEAPKLFGNPIPADQRPKLPAPPQSPPRAPQPEG